MEWRCEWCGKPHAENDPPCDNCGSDEFERAVVPSAPESEGGPTVWVCTDCGRSHPRNNPPCSRCGSMSLERREQDADGADLPDEPDTADDENGRSSVAADETPETVTVWACTECGRAHPRNNPPCSRCGGMTFERREQHYEEAADPDSADGPVPDVGPVADSMTVWACTECGRAHPRNNPPCSRCGNMNFEQREQRFDDAGAGGGGWLEALDPKIAAGFVGATLLLVLVVGGTLGLINVPGIGPPTVTDVPGEDAEVGELSLSGVERDFVAELSARRAGGGATSVEWSDELADVAAYNNRRVVKAAYGEGSEPSEEELVDAFGELDDCESAASYREVVVGPEVGGQPPSDYRTEAALSAALVDAYLERSGEQFVNANNGFAATDVHVGPDGRVFVTVFYC